VKQAAGIFAGLKVIDAASFIAAPAAATILSDFGAEVIKIEPPGNGDPYRLLMTQPGLPECEHNFFWTLEGRNKRSLALDLKSKEGQQVLHRLVHEADVFITNMPLEVRKRLGMAYEQLDTLNHRLIYASFTGYGEAGEEMHKPGFDSTAWWARSGLMDQVRNGVETPPARSLPGMGDHMAALSLFGAIATALYQRQRTGKGACVGSSLLANGAWSNSCMIQGALSGARFTDRPPRDKASSALTNHYRCKDGRWFMLSISIAQETKGFARFAEILGRSELGHDPHFATRTARHKHHLELIAALDAAFATRDAKEWQKLLEAEGFAVSLVARTSDVAEDPQMLATEVLVPMPGAGGKEMTVNSPFWVVGSEKIKPRRAPEVGEHSDEILRAGGYDQAEIERLRKANVVA
jgi:crotonobetainyl-CoA:carnitine CoA-transferase CaiB-like acyl-CoA transferase